MNCIHEEEESHESDSMKDVEGEDSADEEVPIAESMV